MMERPAWHTLTPQQKGYITVSFRRGYPLEAIARGLSCRDKLVRQYVQATGLTRVKKARDLPPLKRFGTHAEIERKRALSRAEKPKPEPKTIERWSAVIWPGWRVHGEVRAA